jgi:hypothetical protein
MPSDTECCPRLSLFRLLVLLLLAAFLAANFKEIARYVRISLM